MHCKPLPGMLIFKLFAEDNNTTCIIKNLNKSYLQPLHRAYAKLYYISTYKKNKKTKKIEKHLSVATVTQLILFVHYFHCDFVQKA